MMPIADLPPMMQERVVCSIAAAARYDIPAHVLLAVAEQEGGKPGQWVRNSNGTWDVGAIRHHSRPCGRQRLLRLQPRRLASADAHPQG